MIVRILPTVFTLLAFLVKRVNASQKAKAARR